MPTTYAKADAKTVALVKKIMGQQYADLADAEVTIDVLFAHNEEGPPVTLHGYPCMAVIKVMSLKDRVAGSADVRLIIDGDGWKNWSDERKRALIDHELYHLELRVKNGKVKTDDIRRPLLRARKHDFEGGGFYTIIARHGKHAIEGQFAALIERRLTQQEFNWGDAIDAAELEREERETKSEAA